MTKAEIVSKIADNTGVDKTVVLAIVEEFMTQVKDSLIERENVYLRGFGSFIVKERKQKVARNITKKESIIVPEHKIPSFKPADSFTEILK